MKSDFCNFLWKTKQVALAVKQDFCKICTTTQTDFSKGYGQQHQDALAVKLDFIKGSGKLHLGNLA